MHDLMCLDAEAMDAGMTVHISWCCTGGAAQVSEAGDVLQSGTISAVVGAVRCVALFSTSRAAHLCKSAPDAGRLLSDSPNLTCTFAHRRTLQLTLLGVASNDFVVQQQNC